MIGNQGITESQFCMWRTLFALVHADNIVTEEEKYFMDDVLSDLPFSDEQKGSLKDDIVNPKDIIKMFGLISDKKDQSEFFKFARDLVWTDGEYSDEEQEVMIKLQEIQIRNVNVDELIGDVELELEPSRPRGLASKAAKKDSKDLIHSFRAQFLKGRFSDS